MPENTHFVHLNYRWMWLFFCDVIVCDYNYLFDPVVYLKRFFAEGPGKYTFLVDEVHNLVDRARSMYSATLKKINSYASQTGTRFKKEQTIAKCNKCDE